MAEPFVAFIADLCHYKAVWEYVQIKKSSLLHTRNMRTRDKWRGAEVT